MGHKKIIKNWCFETSFVDENLFVKNLRTFLSDAQIEKVIKNMEEICPHCFNGNRACQCWHDE
jgi:hypothetical protein